MEAQKSKVPKRKNLPHPKKFHQSMALPAILILSEPGGIFTGSGKFIRNGGFIRRTKRVPGEAREEYERRLKIADPGWAA